MIFLPSKPSPSSPFSSIPSLLSKLLMFTPTLYSNIIIMQNEDNQQLLRKYQRKETFFRQMQSISKRFQQFQQQVYYSPIKDINEHMILKIQGKNQQKRTYILKREDLYIINGQYQPSGQKSFERLILQIVQCIPRPKNSFGIIYVNTLTDSNAYNDFKKVMEMLPVQYLFHLTKIIVLEASFLNKAFTWLSFGTATAYIKNKTINVENLRELSQESHLDIEYLRKILPKNVVQAQLKNEMKESPQQQREMFPLRVTPSPQFALMTRGPVNQEEDQVPGQITRVKSEQPQKKGRFAPIEWGEVKSIKSERPIRKQMSQYQIGPSGAPIILQMLIYFFSNNESYLKLQGLFRKSVSIDDQNEIIQQLNKRNYNFIASVDNPHVIANAIKRFISFFKTPIIPYPMFELFMQKEGSPDFVHIVCQNIKQLPQVNRMTIFLLFDFLKNRVVSFAQHSKMGENNLCIVFGPCLMRSQVASMRELIYAKKVIVVTGIIFKQFENIFGDIHQQEKMRTNSYKQYRLSQNNQRESREVFKPSNLQQPQKSQEDKQKEKQAMSVLHQTSALIKQSYENDQDEPSPEPPTTPPQSFTVSTNLNPTPFTPPQIQ